MRLFISYSREDLELVSKIVRVLKDGGLDAIWDQEFACGPAFLDEVKLSISHCHVFVPLLTERSAERGWVHEEIGYASAMNIPVLPLTYGKTPGQMIEGLNALRLHEDADMWSGQLSYEVFRRLVRWYKKPGFAHYHCAPSLEERTALMAEYASRILILYPNGHGRVRQKAALSSFHLPTNAVNHPAWEQRSGRAATRSRYQNRLLLEERISLNEHALVAGCKLIIDPTLSFEDIGTEARIVRLQELYNFIHANIGKTSSSSHEPLVQVAFGKRLAEHDNLTIVGDWFYSESVATSFKTGYRQTVFTTHAPTVETKITEFDQEFVDTLAGLKWTPEDCCENAAAELEKQLGIHRSNGFGTLPRAESAGETPDGADPAETRSRAGA